MAVYSFDPSCSYPIQVVVLSLSRSRRLTICTAQTAFLLPEYINWQVGHCSTSWHTPLPILSTPTTQSVHPPCGLSGIILHLKLSLFPILFLLMPIMNLFPWIDHPFLPSFHLIRTHTYNPPTTAANAQFTTIQSLSVRATT